MENDVSFSFVIRYTNFTICHLWYQLWTVLEAQGPLWDHLCRLHDHSDDSLNLTWPVNLSDVFGSWKYFNWSLQGHPSTVQSTGCNKTKADLFFYFFFFQMLLSISASSRTNLYMLGQTPYQGQHMKHCISRTSGSCEWHYKWILLQRYTMITNSATAESNICLEKKIMTSSNLLPDRQGRPYSTRFWQCWL